MIARKAGIKRTEKLIIVSFIVVLFISPLLSGCKKSDTPPATVEKKAAEPEKADIQAKAAVQETQQNDQGYIYDRRDRRDPFVPLIETKTKSKTDEKMVMGTLASYDMGDFKVLAIANKGARRYALLLAPGNRSFTVYEGTVLGLNNGKVEKITDNQVITIEHIENYLGKIESRQLILELHKGR